MTKRVMRLESSNQLVDEVLADIEAVRQQTAHLQAMTAQLMPVVMQTNQQIVQALQDVARSNQMVSQAAAQLAAPRRRIPVRDEEGGITEAHDIPMQMH